jgi:MFS family permease
VPDGDPQASGEQNLLRNPGFRQLLITYAINEFGDNFALIALAVLVYNRTSSAIAVTAIFVAAKFIPGLTAPVLTARLATRPVARTLPVLYGIEAVCFAGLALLAAGDPRLGYLLPLAALDGLLAVTGRGLSRGALATLLTPESALRRGNAIINNVFAVVSVLGPIAAVGVLTVSSASVALWIDAASFLIAAFVLIAGGEHLPPAEIDEREGVRDRTREGLRHVWQRPAARRLVIGQALALVFFMLVVPIDVVYAKDAIHAGANAYGWLMAAWGVGILIGSAIFSRIHDRNIGTIVTIATALIAVGYAGLTVSPTLLWACAASVIGGTGNGMQWVGVMTALQEAVDREFFARASGLLETLLAVVPGFAFLAGGAVTALAGPRSAFGVSAIGVSIVALYWFVRPIVSEPQPGT